jgi:hypothetical protein
MLNNYRLWREVVMSEEKEYSNAELEEKYIYLAKYQTSPLPDFLIYIFDWICLLFSGTGSGYGIYWVVTLKYRNGDEIIWSALIPCIILGVALIMGMYLKIFSDTAEKVHKESEKGKGWFNSLLFFESSWDVLIIRIGGVIGMMLFAYGVIDDFNRQKIAEAQFKESIESELKEFANTDSLINKINYYIALKSNGTGDDDLDADYMINYLRKKIKTNESKTDSLRPVYRAQILNVGQTDNTAMIRFLAKGSNYTYGILILLTVAIIAMSIDSAAKTMTGFIAKKKQADHAEKMYFSALERQLNYVNPALTGNVNGNRSIPEGEGIGVDFDSDKVRAIMNQINGLWITGKHSLQDIADNFNVSKTYIWSVKQAMNETGRLISDES